MHEKAHVHHKSLPSTCICNALCSNFQLNMRLSSERFGKVAYLSVCAMMPGLVSACLLVHDSLADVSSRVESKNNNLKQIKDAK